MWKVFRPDRKVQRHLSTNGQHCDTHPCVTVTVRVMQGGHNAIVQITDQRPSSYADRLLSSVTMKPEAAQGQLESAPGQFEGAPGQGSLGSRAQSGSSSPSRPGESSSASGSVHLRDSIAGLLQSEQSASQHSTVSSTGAAKGAAQFSGFDTGIEQITSPGLIKAVRQTDVNHTNTGQMHLPLAGNPTWLHQTGGGVQPEIPTKGPSRQADQWTPGNVDVDASAAGAAATQELQAKGEERIGERAEVAGAHPEGQKSPSAAVGTSLMRLGQLQVPSGLQRGDSVVSEAASEVPASSGRFKQVMCTQPLISS